MANRVSELKKEIKDLKDNQARIKGDISVLSKELARVDKQILSCQSELDSLTGKDIVTISDHALMRYCERVLGIDMDEVRSNILTESTMDLLVKLGAGDGQFPVKEGGFRIGVKNKVVTTVIK